MIVINIEKGQYLFKLGDILKEKNISINKSHNVSWADIMGFLLFKKISEPSIYIISQI